MSKCTAITRGGGRCKGMAIDGSGLCHAHHPDRAEQRSRAARRGGKRGGRGRPQVELSGLVSENAEIRRQVLSGEVAPNVGAVAVQSINAGVRAVKVGLDVREQEELVDRLEQLEALVEGQDEGSKYGA